MIKAINYEFEGLQINFWLDQAHRNGVLLANGHINDILLVNNHMINECADLIEYNGTGCMNGIDALFHFDVCK